MLKGLMILGLDQDNSEIGLAVLDHQNDHAQHFGVFKCKKWSDKKLSLRIKDFKQTEEPTTTQQLGVVLGGSRRVLCDPSAEPGHYGYARGYGGWSRGRWLGFGGFSDGTLSFEGFSSATSSSSSIGDGGEIEDTEKLIDRSINATIVLAAGTFAITKLLTIDQDYWHHNTRNANNTNSAKPPNTGPTIIHTFELLFFFSRLGLSGTPGGDNGDGLGATDSTTIEKCPCSVVEHVLPDVALLKWIMLGIIL
ncbi:hypothetical protein LWI29_033988 [Acer saccharum]|uniref:Uncharacterized protein n=1 Tax=Acer saccharum TaxID=4024 RepID=A0AA39T840_ACESA|nr:hypothetical protein LWI29_033988 [Acer saccharum]